MVIKVEHGKCIDKNQLVRNGALNIFTEYTDKIQNIVLAKLENMDIGNGSCFHVSGKKQHTIYIKSGRNYYTGNKSVRYFLNYTLRLKDGNICPDGISEEDLIETIITGITDYFTKPGQLYKKACSMIDGKIKPRTGPDRIPAVKKFLQILNKRANSMVIGADGFAIKRQYIESSNPEAVLFFPPENTHGVIIKYFNGDVSIYGGKYKNECEFLVSENEPDAVKQYTEQFSSYGIKVNSFSRVCQYKSHKIHLPTVYEMYKQGKGDVKKAVDAWMEQTINQISEREKKKKKEETQREESLKRVLTSDMCRDIYDFAAKNQYANIQATEYTIVCEMMGKRSKNSGIMQHIDNYGHYANAKEDEIRQCISDLCKSGVLKKRTLYAEYGPHPMSDEEITTKEENGTLYMYCYTYVPAKNL